MALRIRPVSDEDIRALVDLTLLAFVPIFESFERILGSSVYQHIWPDWRAGQRDAVETMCGDREKYTVLVANLESSGDTILNSQASGLASECEASDLLAAQGARETIHSRVGDQFGHAFENLCTSLPRRAGRNDDY